MSELLHVSQISVLSEPDRQAVAAAKRWLRYLWQQGFTMEVDAIERDGIFETIQQLDALHARTSGEPQLQGVRR